jgi:maleylacetoacetate isomerase
MKPVLYSYWRSSCSFRVRLGLYYKKIAFDYRPIHLVKDGGEQFSKDFDQLNPKNEVPFFIDDRVQLSESMAILDYLEQVNPERPLFGDDIVERAQILRIAEMVNTGIQPLQNLKVLKKIQEDFHLDDDSKLNWARYWIRLGFSGLEKLLSQQVVKNQAFNLSDCFIIPQVYNAKRFKVDSSEFPHVFERWDRFAGEDYFKHALPETQPDAP